MKYLYCLMTLLFSLSLMADGIYKWVDENGKVHFGDRIPEQYKGQVVDVDPKVNVVNSEVELGPLVRQMQNDRVSDQPPDQGKTSKKSAEGIPSTQYANRFQQRRQECQAKWDAYHASDRCFQTCIIALPNGGTNNARCGHCNDMVKPKCDP